MTHLDLDPNLERLGDALRASTGIDLAREQQAARSATSGSVRFLRRPRMLAGSSLGLAGIGAAIVFALGGSAAAPAFAITTTPNGALVQLNYTSNQNLSQVNAKLASMGINETVAIQMAAGPATVSGPVSCTQGPGASTPVQVLVGANGTDTIGPGQSGGNTAEGTFHLVSCSADSTSSSSNAGNSGA